MPYKYLNSRDCAYVNGFPVLAEGLDVVIFMSSTNGIMWGLERE